jgi:hypothetical protein
VNDREAGTGTSMVTWCAVLQRSDATMPGPSRKLTQPARDDLASIRAKLSRR